MKYALTLLIALSSCAATESKPESASGPVRPTTQYVLYSQKEVARLDKVAGDVTADYEKICLKEKRSMAYLDCYFSLAVIGHAQTQLTLMANIRKLLEMRKIEENLSGDLLLPLLRHTELLIRLSEASAAQNRYLYGAELKSASRAELSEMREVEDANYAAATIDIRQMNRETLAKFQLALKDGKHAKLAKFLTTKDVAKLQNENEETAKLYPTVKK